MPGCMVKTAGTNWLEEVIGLAESGGEGLALAKEDLCQGPGKMRRAVCPLRFGD